MKISYNWLKEYVNVKAAPDKLAEALTMAGLSVESVRPTGSDHIFEIEITANRPDWLSVIGVAREVAALTGAKVKLPPVDKVKVKPQPSPGVKVSVEERGLCPRYTARVIRNVRVQESPAWLRERIEAMGLRSVNNIVDITNFCLFETGEPMHAFDLDKISGGEVIVRKALSSEKIVTIDGCEKTLDSSMLVIADNKKAIAIAGVMGGANTEVAENTRNILLEAAYFDQVSVRRTSRKLAIATDSSYRFERRVDIENIPYASDRALGLILKLASGEAGAFIDTGASKPKPKTVVVKPERVNRLLGTDISVSEMGRIMSALGIGVKTPSKTSIKADVPNFRNDLKSEVDIIEEIARVYGYNRIPVTLPRIYEQPTRMEKDMVVRNKARECLTALGLDEIITYSLLSRKAATAVCGDTDELVTVANPLTSEQEAMRTSLIPGMLETISWNINRKNKDLKLFEIGSVYYKKAGKFGEKKRLSIAYTGHSFESWAGCARAADFYELKGVAEALFAELGIAAVEFARAKEEGFSSGECAAVIVAGEKAGVIGKVAPDASGKFGIKETVFLAELDLDLLLKYVDLNRRFSELARFPSVFRDISILVAKDSSNAELVNTMKLTGGAIVKDVVLIDRYEGKQVPADKKSLTYRLEYRDSARTLEEKDIVAAHERILSGLSDKFGARLR